MGKSKLISDMYFKALTEKMYQIWKLEKDNEEAEEMKKMFGDCKLFDDLIEHNRKNKDRLALEMEELHSAWRESL